MAHAARAMQADDFKRALAQPPLARSEHFVMHAVTPQARASRALPKHAEGDLSTPVSASQSAPVDQAARLGFVLPKRLARRAVTRNLLRRQGRAVWAASAMTGRGGDWVIRLRRAFEPESFRSAASTAMRQAVRTELQALMTRAIAKTPP